MGVRANCAPKNCGRELRAPHRRPTASSACTCGARPSRAPPPSPSPRRRSRASPGCAPSRRCDSLWSIGWPTRLVCAACATGAPSIATCTSHWLSHGCRLVARDAADGEPAAGAAGRAGAAGTSGHRDEQLRLAGVLGDGVDAPRVRREGDARARVDQPEVGARAERRAVEARAAAVDEHAQVAVVQELVVVWARVPLVTAFADLVAWVEVEAAVGRSRAVGPPRASLSAGRASGR